MKTPKREAVRQIFNVSRRGKRSTENVLVFWNIDLRPNLKGQQLNFTHWRIEVRRLLFTQAWVLFAIAFVPSAFAQTDTTAKSLTTAVSAIRLGQQKMLSGLEAKLQEQPNHSESWRSLGRVQLAIGQSALAMDSFERSLQLDPYNAAAHYDIGQLLLQTNRPEDAFAHFQHVYRIAPQSDYAERLREINIPAIAKSVENEQSPPTSVATLATPIGSSDREAAPLADPMPGEIPAEFSESPVQSASYEIKTFDGTDDFQETFRDLELEAIAPNRRLRMFFETGVLYNTNVTLTPVSRELAQDREGSFQAFANPDIDFKMVHSETSRLGPLFRGYFTLNEDQNSDFNLASYQPGLFYEHDFHLGLSEAIGRSEYVVSTDFFDGRRVGQRHAATISLTLIRPDLDAIYGYFRVAQTDFENDGADPGITSLDGTEFTLGMSHFGQTGWQRMPTWSLGWDLEAADTEGTDYRYQSVNLHSSTSVKLSERWQWIPTGGVGYRDYADFTGAVSRNEFFWRLHGRLQFQVNSLMAWSVVIGHDRFASDNVDFDTERTEGGIVFAIAR